MNQMITQSHFQCGEGCNWGKMKINIQRNDYNCCNGKEIVIVEKLLAQMNIKLMWK